MAAAAIIGLRSRPNTGYRAPAAIGTPRLEAQELLAGECRPAGESRFGSNIEEPGRDEHIMKARSFCSAVEPVPVNADVETALPFGDRRLLARGDHVESRIARY